eukprot:1468563-Lingulodinium_polyedra.AAC.1
MALLWSNLDAEQFMNLQNHMHEFTKKFGRELRFGTLFSGCELFSCVANASATFSARVQDRRSHLERVIALICSGIVPEVAVCVKGQRSCASGYAPRASRNL